MKRSKIGSPQPAHLGMAAETQEMTLSPLKNNYVTPIIHILYVMFYLFLIINVNTFCASGFDLILKIIISLRFSVLLKYLNRPTKKKFVRSSDVIFLQNTHISF